MLRTGPYRAAIIGAGGIAQAHAAAFVELGARVGLVAVTDLDPSRTAEFAARFSVPRTYQDAESLLRGEELDLVSICTPPKSHVPLASQVLRAGVTPLVEKPPALSLSEIDTLAAVEQETGQRVLTVFQHRYGASAVRLRRLVKEGALGRPLVATCETQWYRPDAYFEVPWRGRWDTEGGGPTMGHGIHQFDLMLSILGPWSTVSAMAARLSRPTDTEDVSVAVARFANGALATVVNSVVSPRETSRLRFDFENATVELEHLYGYTHDHWTFTPAPAHERLQTLWESADESVPVSGHRAQIEAILDAFDAGAEPGVSLAEARATMEFAAATYASAFRGIPITAGQITAADPFMNSMDGGEVPWPRVRNTLT